MNNQRPFGRGRAQYSYKQRKRGQPVLANPLILKVPGRGIEPRTRGFSVHHLAEPGKHKSQILFKIYNDLTYMGQKSQVGANWQEVAPI